ncbi:hypothetical protein IGM14_000036 [Enterococcus sp. DIV2349]|uniref:hypothetical protein n=1 Tax=Enterococcus TaxID=1350 RepID=UPI00032FF212|nr:hypothetical protein [Enterococcus faecalis]EGO8264844.1 hypothetical protein [Enterococcus faecalis]EGO8651773.1 hypothetical protein [Enterococcus faecalis]EHF1085925.1 hypothetical protein [Enterococcus faecalis]EHK9982110.1 hypothetical protein [Enterococcus faecalis]EJR9795344.1 hypothetical protein [Enterococcus faecalis]
MEDLKDFDLNITQETQENSSVDIQPRSTSVVSTVIWSIIGTSAATTQFGGDPTWTENSKCR